MGLDVVQLTRDIVAINSVQPTEQQGGLGSPRRYAKGL